MTVPALGDSPAPADTPLDEMPPLMWHGVIAREGVYTDDGRFWEPGAFRTQPLPFPARFQRSDIGGHDGAVVIGNTEAVRRYQGAIRAWGTFADGSLTPEVGEVQGLMATGMTLLSVQLLLQTLRHFFAPHKAA